MVTCDYPLIRVGKDPFLFSGNEYIILIDSVANHGSSFAFMAILAVFVPAAVHFKHAVGGGAQLCNVFFRKQSRIDRK